jgi:hypothetical protein
VNETPGDNCPLCETPLRAEQSWCMQCGAPARTRLAPAPRWRALVAVLTAVIVVSVGAIIAGVAVLAG